MCKLNGLVACLALVKRRRGGYKESYRDFVVSPKGP